MAMGKPADGCPRVDDSVAIPGDGPRNSVPGGCGPGDFLNRHQMLRLSREHANNPLLKKVSVQCPSMIVIYSVPEGSNYLASHTCPGG